MDVQGINYTSVSFQCFHNSSALFVGLMLAMLKGPRNVEKNDRSELDNEYIF